MLINQTARDRPGLSDTNVCNMELAMLERHYVLVIILRNGICDMSSRPHHISVLCMHPVCMSISLMAEEHWISSRLIGGLCLILTALIQIDFRESTRHPYLLRTAHTPFIFSGSCAVGSHWGVSILTNLGAAEKQFLYPKGGVESKHINDNIDWNGHFNEGNENEMPPETIDTPNDWKI